MKNFQETPMNKDNESQESSWTSYFEDFLWQNDQKVIMSCNETLNSLVSNATSSSNVEKSACFQEDQAKKLRFKKRKHIGAIVDDSLEDTASSPLISQKEKIGKCEEQNKRRASLDMELKKRGLCLVPLSSLASYLESQDIFLEAQPLKHKQDRSNFLD
ncbi:hypothetical protein L1987_07429 [Smallanthus sonchifolius]|uniref:Uncharacterized protein n=1 Tax=Smallanthus sonchifolius TaxID=185202 RepID=A0ACB9K0N3_9ASTR|nr:hypothetical protein L1987_07429 [Smallanthus sonchifolius]